MESRPPFQMPLHPTRVGLFLGVLLVLLPIVLWIWLVTMVTTFVPRPEGRALATIATRAPAQEAKAP